MSLSVSQDIKVLRRFFDKEFSLHYPLSLKCLHDMFTTGSKAYKDIENAQTEHDTAIAYTTFTAATSRLYDTLKREDYFHTDTSEEQIIQFKTLIEHFFKAYPHWPEVRALWDAMHAPCPQQEGYN